jgi:hypothetical protein
MIFSLVYTPALFYSNELYHYLLASFNVPTNSDLDSLELTQQFILCFVPDKSQFHIDPLIQKTKYSIVFPRHTNKYTP